LAEVLPVEAHSQIAYCRTLAHGPMRIAEKGTIGSMTYVRAGYVLLMLECACIPSYGCVDLATSTSNADVGLGWDLARSSL